MDIIFQGYLSSVPQSRVLGTLDHVKADATILAECNVKTSLSINIGDSKNYGSRNIDSSHGV